MEVDIECLTSASSSSSTVVVVEVVIQGSETMIVAVVFSSVYELFRCGYTAFRGV